ncbi:MAG: DVU0524 family FlgM-associated protein [Desulfobacterium sp.]|nr:DVU0524 family FlgM-associated protein [Desulfobacterium sp.]
MQIPSYQIRNVLKNYSRQLSQGKILARNRTAGNFQADNVSISAEAKRTTILEKVTATIVDRITTMGPQEEFELKITDQVQQELGQRINFTPRKEDSFSFTSIDKDNVKTIKTLSVEDSQFVIRRLTELARKAADSNMATIKTKPNI